MAGPMTRKTLSEVVNVDTQFWRSPIPTTGAGDELWSTNPGVCHVPEKRRPLARAAERQLTARCVNGLSRAAQISAWAERELELAAHGGQVPQADRVRILGEAFGRAVEHLPEYRPLLYSYQREMDDFVEKLQDQVRDLLNVEGRLKTVKMESIAFVGESTMRFQEEVRQLRQSLAECERSRDEMGQEKAAMKSSYLEMKKRSDRDRFLAEESHKQNLDILSNLERSEKQVEALRKQERENYGEIARLQHQIKDQDQRNKMVEAQLNAERAKHVHLVAKEEHEALKEELKAARNLCLEWEEKHLAKDKDYQNIVDVYKKHVGGDTNTVEARPLTPRPIWTSCRGVLDLEGPRSMELSDQVQELVVRLMSLSRTLLAPYGLHAAYQRSALLGKFARHPSTIPLVLEAGPIDRQKVPQEEHREDHYQASGGMDKSCESFKEEEKWLPPDMDSTTPLVLRHQDKIRNQRLSRKKTLDCLERVLHLRLREGDGMLSRPYLHTMMEVLSQELGEEGKAFAVNLFAATQRYASEPDFLCYLLLLRGFISDTVVRDNALLCTELLRLFRGHFEEPSRATKEKVFKGLREALPHKEKDQCQELLSYFPPGGPSTIVNYEWLLLDDIYVICPMVYALRLQHLEECLNFSERLEKVTKSCVGQGGLVKFETLEAACKEDSLLAVLQPEDLARSFQTPMQDLGPGVDAKGSELIELLKNGHVFHELFFPAHLEEEKDTEDAPCLVDDLDDVM